MRENRTSGTVWGVPGNRYPYHDYHEEMKPNPSKPIDEPILDAPKAVGNTEVVSLSYDLYNLTIGISDEQRNSILVVFQDVLGFRVLDERDLMEFWPEFSTPAGWAFRITKGGWHDHEAKRVGCFLIPDVSPEAKESFFTGCNDCISVISTDEPKFVCRAGAEPSNSGGG